MDIQPEQVFGNGVTFNLSFLHKQAHHQSPRKYHQIRMVVKLLIPVWHQKPPSHPDINTIIPLIINQHIFTKNEFHNFIFFMHYDFAYTYGYEVIVV